MKKHIAQIATLGLLALGMALLPVVSSAADMKTNTPADQMTPKPKHTAIPFRGKISAVDTKAMTLTVGNRTFEITSETKILKDGQPATLSEGAVGEQVRGTYKKTEDGKLEALSVQFGAKQKTAGAEEN